MNKNLFIGDIIACQIGHEFNTEVITCSTSHDLVYLGIKRLDLTGYSHIYYSMGYADLIYLSRVEIHGFKDRVEQDIKQLLSHNLPVTFIIPLLPEDASEDEIDKSYHKTYNIVQDSIDYIVEEYELETIDLRDILNTIHQDGLNQEDLNNIREFFI